jgi:hypothetical protein
MKPEVWNAILKRSAILLFFSTLLMFLINEGVHLLRQDRVSRAPQIIQLDIPEGTAQKVASGQSIDDLPKNMIFVVGDTLQVNNLDTDAHELGPLWIPPGSSATLNLEMVSDFAYSCSFNTTQYMGLTVREATTFTTRLVGLWYGVPPLFMFFMVYSFVIWPIKSKEDVNI